MNPLTLIRRSSCIVFVQIIVSNLFFVKRLGMNLRHDFWWRCESTKSSIWYFSVVKKSSCQIGTKNFWLQTTPVFVEHRTSDVFIWLAPLGTATRRYLCTVVNGAPSARSWQLRYNLLLCVFVGKQKKVNILKQPIPPVLPSNVVLGYNLPCR